jgi:hypothetical protein
MNFTDPEIDKLIESNSKVNFNPPYEFDKRFTQLYDIVKIILADELIDENEMRLANMYATKLGFKESEIPKLLNLLIDGIKEGKDDDDLFEAYKSEKRSW